MKKIISLLAILFLASCQTASKNIGAKAHSKILNNEGKKIGEAFYTQGSHGVLIEVKVEKLPAGKRGMHFHEVGTCKDHQTFQMAKGHIMPTNKPHGYFHPKGPHEGNLPNLIVAKNGTAHVEIYSDLISLYGENGKAALLDENGSTLIIHANEDDHLTQPIGNAGARIACGVVEKKV